jgi:hypothetical protein
MLLLVMKAYNMNTIEMRRMMNLLEGTSGWGGSIPYAGILQRIASRDPPIDKQQQNQRDKEKQERNSQLNKLRDYSFSDIRISKESVVAYANGDNLIPAMKLNLGPKLLYKNDERIVRDNKQWCEFAIFIYDKVLEQITNNQHRPSSTVKNSESWTSLSRKRNLLVKEILIKNHAKSAEFFNSD